MVTYAQIHTDKQKYGVENLVDRILANYVGLELGIGSFSSLQNTNIYLVTGITIHVTNTDALTVITRLERTVWGRHRDEQYSDVLLRWLLHG